jgi:hypothetical protein
MPYSYPSCDNTISRNPVSSHASACDNASSRYAVSSHFCACSFTHDSKLVVFGQSSV